MNKKEFLKKLKLQLHTLSYKEQKERLTFYSEAIDDRIEEGLTEEEAVNAMGSIDEIVLQIKEDNKNNPIKYEKKPLTKWEITLLIIGSPLWACILIIFFAVLFSVYAVIWAINLVLWTFEIPFYFLSKYLLIGCKYTYRFSLEFTKKTFIGIKNFIKRG